MKKCFIFLCCIFGLSLTLKATELCLLEMPIHGTNVVFVALGFDSQFKSFIEKNNISIDEAENLLISYINKKPNQIDDSTYNPVSVLADFSKISNSDKVIDYIDTIIKSNRSNLYDAAMTAFLYACPYSVNTLNEIEKYIKLNDNSSVYRRNRIFVRLSFAIDVEDTLSVETKFTIIKLMLKYLTFDLHNWVYLDKTLLEKIPSYRYSIERRSMIQHIQSNFDSLTNWQKNEFNQILNDFNKLIPESKLNSLTDEVIRKEIENYKCTKYEELEI